MTVLFLSKNLFKATSKFMENKLLSKLLNKLSRNWMSTIVAPWNLVSLLLMGSGPPGNRKKKNLNRSLICSIQIKMGLFHTKKLVRYFRVDFKGSMKKT